MPTKADVLFHPIRLRIVQELYSKDYPGLDLLHALGDVPQATFYRHLKVLVDHGLVVVVEESESTKEKIYRLAQDGSRMTAEDVKDMTPEEQMQMFTVFTSQLLHTAETFFDTEPDYTKAKFGYGKVDFHLTDEEWKAFATELGALIRKYGELERRKETETISLTQYLIPKGARSNE